MLFLDETETSVHPVRKINKTIGRDLDRITRGLNAKLPIQVTEGNLRPEAPMQAAKLASQGGVILGDHFPILRSWNEYKKDGSIVKNFIGKVAVS